MLGMKLFLGEILFTPTYISQNDQCDEAVILSHICSGPAPPSPAPQSATPAPPTHDPLWRSKKLWGGGAV